MDELWRLARWQYGLLSIEQVRPVLSRGQLHRLVASGTLLRLRRGVFVVAGAPPSYEQAVLAAVLAVAGGDVWASHRTAARLHGLRVPPPEAIDLMTMPHRRVRLDGVAHHRNKLVVIGDTTLRGPIPVTSVARTLVDCLPWLPGRTLATAVDDARRRGLLSVDDLEAAHAALDEGPRTGRHLVRPMRPVLAQRLAGHLPGGSDRELDVLEILRRAGLPLPVQQFRIVVAGRERVLDYAYPMAKVYLEFDGFAEHGLIRSTFDDDRERDAELALLGWLGLHFTSATKASDLVDRVDRALVARAA